MPRTKKKEELYAPDLLAKVPRTMMANTQYRIDVNNNPDVWPLYMKACGEHCPEALILWLNVFGFAYEPRRSMRMANSVAIPFITWPSQDGILRDYYEAVANESDLLIDKSRDSGASWLGMATYLWFWRFWEGVQFLVASRKEDLVDHVGDPNTLFWKLDWLYGHLPPWMQLGRGQYWRKFKQMRNEANACVIQGEATTGDLGRAGRCLSAFFDEFASVLNAREVLAATADITNSRIYVSTPKGMGHTDSGKIVRGNTFGALRHNGVIKVSTMHWSHDPRKNADLEYILDPDTKQEKPTSTWYRAECKRRMSLVEVAQELDIDYLAAGGQFFDAKVTARIRAGKWLIKPVHKGWISWAAKTTDDGVVTGTTDEKWHEDPEGGGHEISTWARLDEDGRLPPNRSYVAFSDISNGAGASNSVMDVWCVESREQIAQLVTSRLMPQEFAVCCYALLELWSPNSDYIFLGWESNGPGQDYGRQILRMGWPYYYRARAESEPNRRKGRNFGWHSSRTTKRILLGELRGAMGRNECLIHCEQTIIEAETYIVYDSGTIGPGELLEESTGARETHGDRVISGAGAYLMLSEKAKHPLPHGTIPANCPAGRRLAWEREQAAKKNDSW